MKVGYKQTEVGEIPIDWEVQSLQTLAEKIMVGIASAATHAYRVTGIVLLRNQNIKSGYLDDSDVLYISEDYEAVFKNKRLQTGDLLTARTGYPGATCVVPPLYESAQSFTTLITRPKPGSVNSEFLCCYINSSQGQAFFVRHQIGGGQKNVNAGSLKHLPVPIPPTQVEQEAIAEALRDSDALIESLEQIIAKKRLVKQGAMQELLTGNTRLSGFNEPWKRKPFAELFEFSGGFSASRSQLSDDGFFYLHYGDIHHTSKTFIDVLAEDQAIPKLKIALNQIAPASLLGDGDVVFVDASEDDDGASKHVVIVNKDNRPFISGLHTIVAKRKGSDLDPLFLRYCFQTSEIKQQFYYYAVGTKVTGISKRNIAKLILEFPERREQAAIGGILSDIDSEIEALEAKLTKARQVKEGMMHNLLTGRIRLLQQVHLTSEFHSVQGTTPTRPHSWAFNEAVIISALTDQFGSDDFPLGRMRYTKLSYLLHRKTDQDVTGYLKKAAGPYNPRTKYAGPERIAKQNQYVREHRHNLLHGLIVAENVQSARDYFVKWYGDEVKEWLEQFRYKTNDELERLGTVDMAMQELLKKGQAIDVESVRVLIETEPEWLPKLNRSIFSNTGIASAISECKTLFD